MTQWEFDVFPAKTYRYRQQVRLVSQRGQRAIDWSQHVFYHVLYHVKHLRESFQMVDHEHAQSRGDWRSEAGERQKLFFLHPQGKLVYRCFNQRHFLTAHEHSRENLFHLGGEQVQCRKLGHYRDLVMAGTY